MSKSEIPHNNPFPTLEELNRIWKGSRDNNLKSFILLCQTVENAYMEWKNYWLKILTE